MLYYLMFIVTDVQEKLNEGRLFLVLVWMLLFVNVTADCSQAGGSRLDWPEE